MEKKIKKIDVTKEKVKIKLKNGKEQVLPSKTTYTYYEDGSNDCKVEILEPLKLSGNTQEVE